MYIAFRTQKAPYLITISPYYHQKTGQNCGCATNVASTSSTSGSPPQQSLGSGVGRLVFADLILACSLVRNGV